MPWWQDNQYVVGLLTTKVRKVRIKNMLTCSEHTLQVKGLRPHSHPGVGCRGSGPSVEATAAVGMEEDEGLGGRYEGGGRRRRKTRGR